MKIYADTPARRLGQLASDLTLLVWIGIWIKLGLVVHEMTMGLARPGAEIDQAGSGLADRLREAAGGLHGVPLVGDTVSRPFEGAGGAADALAAAGRSQVEAVSSLAFWLGLVVVLIPILVALAIHLPLRVRFVRRATAGQRFLDASEDLDLFALRALARQPLHVLARISPDPAGAWRHSDATVIRRLADLELRTSGLRPPPEVTG